MAYNKGTVKLTHGSSTVTGSSKVEWLKYISSGGVFKKTLGTTIYTVDRIVSNTELLLSSPYQGETESDAQYSINMNRTANISIPLLDVNIADPTVVLNQALITIDKNAGQFLDFDSLGSVEYSGENGFYIRGNYRSDELKEGRALKFMGATGELIAYDWLDNNSIFEADIMTTPEDNIVSYYNNPTGESQIGEWDVVTNTTKNSYVFVKTVDEDNDKFTYSGEFIGTTWAIDDEIKCFGKTMGYGEIDTGLTTTVVPLTNISGESVDLSEFKTSDLLYNYNRNNLRTILVGEVASLSTQLSDDNWAVGDRVYTVKANIKTKMRGLTSNISNVEYGAQSQIGEDSVKASHIDFGSGSDQVDASIFPVTIPLLDAVYVKDAIEEVNDDFVNHLTTGEAHSGNEIKFVDDNLTSSPLTSVHMQDAVNELKYRVNTSAYLTGTIDDADDNLNFYDTSFINWDENFFNSGEWYCHMLTGTNQSELSNLDSFENVSGEFVFASGEGWSRTPEVGDTFAMMLLQPLQGEKGETGATGADSTVQGPSGEQGIQGIQGEQGESGEVGPSGDVGTSGTPEAFDYARFVNATEIAGLTSGEVVTDLGVSYVTGFTHMEALSSGEYAALGTPDVNTIYFVSGEV